MGWAGIEKRRFIRADFPCKILIYTPGEHTISTHTENIGAGGIRIIIEEKLDIFSRVILKLFLDGSPITSKGRVVWVVDKPTAAIDESDLYDTGIEFYEIKDEDRKIISDLIEKILSEKK